MSDLILNSTVLTVAGVMLGIFAVRDLVIMGNYSHPYTVETLALYVKVLSAGKFVCSIVAFIMASYLREPMFEFVVTLAQAFYALTLANLFLQTLREKILVFDSIMAVMGVIALMSIKFDLMSFLIAMVYMGALSLVRYAIWLLKTKDPWFVKFGKRYLN